MARIAVYPGSFDPITRGHEDLIRRGFVFAERIIVAVAASAGKTPLFTLDERVALAKACVGDDSRIEVKPFDGLLVDFARRIGAALIIRGLRYVSDFEYEYQMALMNRKLADTIETVFLVPSFDLTYLSSSLVREVARYGADVTTLVHPAVDAALRKKFAARPLTGVSGPGFQDELRRRASATRRRVVLSEGQDPRVRGAARALAAGGLQVALIGDPATREWAAAEAPAVRVRLPLEDPSLEGVAGHLARRRPDKAGPPEQARALAADPLRFAASLVALGEADATVGGAVHTTGDVLRAAFWAVGPADGITTVSSSMYMVTADHGVLTFTDAGVVQYPTAEQLADIALAAARDRRRITGDAPRVAFLSHGTRGSAAGASIDRVREALAIFRERAPEIPADGELQADAALVPAIAERKAPGGILAGRANVLVFPDLDSGNIAYKLVQRIAQVAALGPVVQGLAKPCCDLSRGASQDDVELVAAIAILQSESP